MPRGNLRLLPPLPHDRCPMPLRPCLAALLALGLAACSDFDGSLDDDAPPSFADLQDLQADIGGPASATFALQPEAVPTSGGASFEGVMEIGTEGTGGLPTTLLGELDLALDFGAPADLVSGTAGNFVAADGERLDGALALSGGDLGGDASFEDAGLAGVLTDGDGADFTFDGTLDGTLKGDDTAVTPTQPTYVDGQGLGVVTGPDGATGGFVAEFDTIREGLTPPAP